MKTTALYCLGLVLSLAISTSCRKETNPPEPVIQPPTGNPATVEAMLNRLAAPLQTYTINADTLSRDTCTNGTIIVIPKNALVTQAGLTVHGIVNVEVKEILSKKDMILNNSFQVSNMLPLISGGGLYIAISQNGENLKIDPTRVIIYYFPTDAGSSSQVRMFYASGPPNLATTSLNWLPDGAALPASKTRLNGNYYYFLFSKSLGWVACGNYYSFSAPKTTCTVNLSGEFNRVNTMVFITKNNEPVTARFFPVNGSTAQQFQSTTDALPVGEAYTVAAIGYDGKDYYSSFLQVTMTETMVIDLPALVKTTKSQIEINLAGLP